MASPRKLLNFRQNERFINGSALLLCWNGPASNCHVDLDIATFIIHPTPMDPLTPPRERLDALERQIAELSLRIDLAKHQLLTALREFDAQEGWSGTGFLSTAAWLAWRIDTGQATAREHVRVARALGELPRTDAAFASGKLSYSKVRAITRVAKPESEQDFIDVALHATASQLEKITAAYRRTSTDPHEPPLSQRRFVRRSETASGMVRIDMQLPPEQANVVWQALEAALDAGRSEDVSAETSVNTRPPMVTDPATLQAEQADAMVNLAQAYLDHTPRTLGAGYELVLMTTPEQLEHGNNGIGGYLRDGTPVPLHVARMLACDCARVDVDMSASGELLNVGRARRSVPSAIGRALWLRDGGCRVPGCGRKRHLHAHHIHNWAKGGETSLSNLVLLCSSHHAAVHDEQLRVYMHEGRIEFENVHGLRLKPGPGPERLAGVTKLEGVDEFEGWLGDMELEVERDRYPTWDGSRLDLDAVLSALYAAEAWREAAST